MGIIQNKFFKKNYIVHSFIIFIIGKVHVQTKFIHIYIYIVNRKKEIRNNIVYPQQ